MIVRNTEQVDWDSLEAITFVSWVFKNTLIHFAEETIRPEGEIWDRGASPAERIENTCEAHFMRRNRFEDGEVKPIYSTIGCNGYLKRCLYVYEPGLLFCPLSGEFWTEGVRRRYQQDQGWAPNQPGLWEAAVNRAKLWVGNPSFKYARSQAVREAGNRWDYMLRRGHCRYNEQRLHLLGFLDSIGQSGVSDAYRNPPPPMVRVVASIARHVRRHGKHISSSAIRFFQMHAGASAINAALQNHATNRTNPTNQPVRHARPTGNRCVGAGR